MAPPEFPPTGRFGKDYGKKTTYFNGVSLKCEEKGCLFATGQSIGVKMAAIENYAWEFWEHWEYWGQWDPMAAKENGILPEFAKWTLAAIGHS
jgi:hypothetical protein